MAMLEVLQVARPDAQKVETPQPDGFKVMIKAANSWLATDRDPVSSINTRKWAARLGVGSGLLEYFMYLGDTGKLDHDFDSFVHRRMHELMNFQIPRLLHNAAFITNAREKGLRSTPPQEKSFAWQAARILTTPPPSVKK